jgi:hypothetical protein
MFADEYHPPLIAPGCLVNPPRNLIGSFQRSV